MVFIITVFVNFSTNIDLALLVRRVFAPRSDFIYVLTTAQSGEDRICGGSTVVKKYYLTSTGVVIPSI